MNPKETLVSTSSSKHCGHLPPQSEGLLVLGALVGPVPGGRGGGGGVPADGGLQRGRRGTHPEETRGRGKPQMYDCNHHQWRGIGSLCVLCCYHLNNLSYILKVLYHLCIILQFVLKYV